PERDKYSQSKVEIKAMMASLFGGRVAEELIFGPDKVTTGASDDIRRATGIARRMVTEFGFSEKLGPLRYADNEEEVFLGHSVTQRKNVSDATARVIDEEIRRIVDEGERTAREILTGHLDELHALAKGLLEYETLSAAEIRRVFIRVAIGPGGRTGAMARKLFGTDGIRGTANSEPMTPETALKVAMAVGESLHNGTHKHLVVIGKDTRLSGYMLEPALTAGFITMGMDVVLVGPLPTPAIAMLTRSLRADIGVVISASHNPFGDNG